MPNTQGQQTVGKTDIRYHTCTENQFEAIDAVPEFDTSEEFINCKRQTRLSQLDRLEKIVKNSTVSSIKAKEGVLPKSNVLEFLQKIRTASERNYTSKSMLTIKNKPKEIDAFINWDNKINLILIRIEKNFSSCKSLNYGYIMDDLSVLYGFSGNIEYEKFVDKSVETSIYLIGKFLSFTENKFEKIVADKGLPKNDCTLNELLEICKKSYSDLEGDLLKSLLDPFQSPASDHKDSQYPPIQCAISDSLTLISELQQFESQLNTLILHTPAASDCEFSFGDL